MLSCVVFTSVLLRNVLFVPQGLSRMLVFVTVRFWKPMSDEFGNSVRAAHAHLAAAGDACPTRPRVFTL